VIELKSLHRRPRQRGQGHDHQDLPLNPLRFLAFSKSRLAPREKGASGLP
jgi:hypothetical protein